MVFIVICTTALFTVLTAREARNLQNYMGYIAENGKSALFHEESVSQNIAARLSREFYTLTSSPLSDKDLLTEVCQHVETQDGMYGLNLQAKTMTNLNGTLQ
jgi:hypothetical protein